MPYKTIWEDRGIVWEFWGYVTAEEIESANSEFYSDKRSDKVKYQIINALNVTGVEWQEQNIRDIAAHDLGATYVNRKVKVAYVAVKPDIISKLQKYIDISRKLNSSWKFEGFSDMEQARAWVNTEKFGT